MTTECLAVGPEPSHGQRQTSLTRREVLKSARFAAGALCSAGVLAACENGKIPTGSRRTSGSPFDYRPVSVGTRFASSDCFWYRPLPNDDSCRLTTSFRDSRGATHTEAQLLDDLARQMANTYPLLLVNNYTPKFYEVERHFPLQKLQIYQNGAYRTFCPHLNSALATTPLPLTENLPSGASVRTAPPGGTDRIVYVWQPSRDTFWELNYSQYAPDESNFPFGVFWGNVAYNCSRVMGVVPLTPAYERAERWGSSASGMYVNAGCVMWSDWALNHHIPHALYFQTWGTQPAFTYPAYKGDGFPVQNANAIPHGTMFRFDPGIDLSPTDSYGSCSRYGLTPFAAAMARAIQTFGMISGDGSGTVSWSAEDVSDDTWNPGPSRDWWRSDGVRYGGSAANPSAEDNDVHSVVLQCFNSTLMTHLQVIDPAWTRRQGRGP